MSVNDAVALVKEFRGPSLAKTVALLQSRIERRDTESAAFVNHQFGITPELLLAAADIKRASAQIDVVIHAAGIVYALPHLLEPDERVLSSSLGAGTAQSDFDLVTDRRIAEFKFIFWQGGSEAIRKKTLFADYYKLARETSDRAKYLYLLNTDIPLKFLQGKRQINKVLKMALLNDFRQRFGDTYQTVGEFHAAVGHQIHLVDLTQTVPGFAAFMERMER